MKAIELIGKLQKAIASGEILEDTIVTTSIQLGWHECKMEWVVAPEIEFNVCEDGDRVWVDIAGEEVPQ